jgi:hypothetical protein
MEMSGKLGRLRYWGRKIRMFMIAMECGIEDVRKVKRCFCKVLGWPFCASWFSFALTIKQCYSKKLMM